MIKITKPDLQKLTTIKLPGQGRILYILEEERDLVFLDKLFLRKESPFILGRGSNIIFEEKNNNSLVKWCSKSKEIKVISKVDKEVLLLVDASISLPKLLQYCIKNGFSGLEPLAGVPASVGGAVAMNAGSHGIDIGDVWEKLIVWIPLEGIKEVRREKASLEYRSLNLAVENYLILKALIKLKLTSGEEVKKKVSFWYKQKKAKQPLTYPSAGCIFKNPKGLSAGKILDECGFKGKTIGGMAFSPLHANFLINLGAGKAKEALQLIDLAREEVFKKKNILLEPEVKIVRWQ